MSSFMRNKANGRAPTTVFSTAAMSPRQVANKAYSLACKKLDRDDRRSRPRYNIRERLLLCNTINKAEDVLNKRTQRFNRRVLSIEDEDHKETPEPLQPHTAKDVQKSSLRSSGSEEEEEETQIESVTMTLAAPKPIVQEQPFIHQISAAEELIKDTLLIPKAIPAPVFVMLPSGHLEQLIALSESMAEALLPRDCRLIMSHTMLPIPIAAAII
ncbi:hypothetical protein CLU79DRAFT_295265 [Phycomyces nitens]|nr:hypothetical protein CLU79DRAFT_295265 [Phycomyces nitens]